MGRGPMTLGKWEEEAIDLPALLRFEETFGHASRQTRHRASCDELRLAGWCGRDEERVPTACLLFQQISQNPHARKQHTVKYTKERKKNNAMSAGKCD
jgi:hypothetical protein